MKFLSLNALLNETGAEILKTARAPEYIIPTLALPVAFYALFGVALQQNVQSATYMLATFGVFAVMGPAIFGFGAGVASERERGWLGLKRATPAPGFVYIGAKLLVTLIFAAIAVGLIYAVAGFAGGVALPRPVWGLLLATHLLAAIPFVLIGLTIGFTFNSNGAVAFANVLFLGLSVCGGLWIPIFVLPGFMQAVAHYLPSYHLGQIALSAAGIDIDHAVGTHLAAIGITAAIFAVLAIAAWLRQR